MAKIEITRNVSGPNSCRLITCDYGQCWYDLKDKIDKYYEEKSKNLSKDSRYCIALSVEEIRSIMTEIEKNNKKYYC